MQCRKLSQQLTELHFLHAGGEFPSMKEKITEQIKKGFRFTILIMQKAFKDFLKWRKRTRKDGGKPYHDSKQQQENPIWKDN